MVQGLGRWKNFRKGGLTKQNKCAIMTAVKVAIAVVGKCV